MAKISSQSQSQNQNNTKNTIDVNNQSGKEEYNSKSQEIAHCVYYKNKNGLGGVAIDQATQNKILIEKNVENFALEYDEIEVKSWVDNANVSYGSIQKITKHNTSRLVGNISLHKNQPFLNVTDPKFGNYLVKIKSEINPAINRDELFSAEIINYPTRENPYFEAHILNSIGTIDEAQAFITRCIIESNLPIEFSLATLEQTKQIADTISNNDIQNRQDLRELSFVTIDGEDAKDFDDAVYCSVENNIFSLFVAIADVAHYVTDGSPLDQDAYLRSTSVYFPQKVIPMLPEQLSNGICSLNPHVDRLTMCVEMKIDSEGTVIDYKVYNAVINSKFRLTYDQVQQWINDLSIVPSPIVSNISNLYLVFLALLKARKKRGAIDFESDEPQFEFAKDGTVSKIVSRSRLESHKLIEECMLAANVCIAGFLIKNNHEGLFRNHEKPSSDKFLALKHYLDSLAIKFDTKYDDLTPHDYANLLREIHDHPDFITVQQIVLRSMQLAIYSPNNIGHFGLSYKEYAHFTSPIRRYPDLLVHRACKSILLKKQYLPKYPLVLMGEHTSFAERRAENLERKVDAFYKCQYAKSHIGKEFEGIITSLVNFGVFVYLPELMLEGLIHVTELGEDYFIFDDKKQSLVGKNSGVSYHNGQIVHTQISSVDMAQLFIDLTLV